MVDQGEKLRHLLVSGTASTEPYSYPRDVKGSAGIKLPPRDRQSHAQHLQTHLAKAKTKINDIKTERTAKRIVDAEGMYLELASDPDLEVHLKPLDSHGIELVAVRELGSTMRATIFVPDGKLQVLEKKVESYRTKDHQTYGSPLNQKLVESISEIRTAALESFWTDQDSLLPSGQQNTWWEVWLRARPDREALEKSFRSYAEHAGISVKAGSLNFADRTVVLAFGTAEQMTSSIELLDCIAELRLAKETPEFFMGLETKEQADWIGDLANNTSWPSAEAPAVSLLDTGINRGHPLLSTALQETDMHACEPNWGTADNHGHGTEMAGLALFGDLTLALETNEPLEITHRLESVKILRNPGDNSDDRELHGKRTEEAVARLEITAPGRRRVLCMPVSAPDFRDNGVPSSWSAAVDKIGRGNGEDNLSRLVILSGGNVHCSQWHLYPSVNDTEQIHDPGQAWNALTVGAYTEKAHVEDPDFQNWTLLAEPGTVESVEQHVTDVGVAVAE